MKILKRVLIIIATLTIILVIGAIALFNNMKKTTLVYNDFDFSTLDLSKVPDGTYIGSEDGKLVKASVEVTIKNHIITDVTLLSHDCGKGKSAEVIVDDIESNNSLEVDTISGATYSSNVIKVAVYNALTQ